MLEHHNARHPSSIWEFQEGRAHLRGINKTLLVLIPKQRGVESLRDRPISLLHGTYKIITKLLAMRLDCIIDRLVNCHQGAFHSCQCACLGAAFCLGRKAFIPAPRRSNGLLGLKIAVQGVAWEGWVVQGSRFGTLGQRASPLAQNPN